MGISDNPSFMLPAFHVLFNPCFCLGLLRFPTNGSHELFTLMAIDPDVPSRSYSTYSQFLQWLVVNIPQEDMSRGPHDQSSPFTRFISRFYDQTSLLV